MPFKATPRTYEMILAKAFNDYTAEELEVKSNSQIYLLNKLKI